MRALMLSKALVSAHYQGKAAALALNPDLDLTVVTPPDWQDERGALTLERNEIYGCRLVVTPLRFNGHYHLHYYPRIGEIMREAKPDLVHLDEEPYNLATFHALIQTRRSCPHARVLFFSWQNLEISYPPPFSWMESYVYTHSDYALAGSPSAERVLRSKGFAKQSRVIPQFGVDPQEFHPDTSRALKSKFTIGLAARLVPEKGASILLSALGPLTTEWELKILGSGPERSHLEQSARRLGFGNRVRFLEWQPSGQMPEFYRSLDVLVAPSVSRPNWTEQFGRVLVEAMSCAVPVIGSSAGEIPNVIGDAGLVFTEGDVRGLAEALRSIMMNEALRVELGMRGRARVLERFTQEHIAQETYAVYRELMSN